MKESPGWRVALPGFIPGSFLFANALLRRTGSIIETLRLIWAMFLSTAALQGLLLGLLSYELERFRLDLFGIPLWTLGIQMVLLLVAVGLFLFPVGAKGAEVTLKLYTLRFIGLLVIAFLSVALWAIVSFNRGEITSSLIGVLAEILIAVVAVPTIEQFGRRS